LLLESSTGSQYDKHYPQLFSLIHAGLPDFSFYNTPKRENIPNGCQLLQMAIKLTKIFRSKAFPNIPKVGFLACKYTIWQPCIQE
jgi:hypothetical protein